MAGEENSEGMGGRWVRWARARQARRSAAESRRDLRSALFQSKVRRLAGRRGEAMASRGRRWEASVLFLVILCARILGMFIASWWAGIGVAGIGASILLGDGGAFGVDRRDRLYEAWMAWPGRAGLELAARVPGGLWLWAWLASSAGALGCALALGPTLPPRGWAWRALGLNPFAVAGAEGAACSESWRRRGMAVGDCAGLVLWSDPRLVASAFEPVGLYGFFALGAIPWHSPWRLIDSEMMDGPMADACGQARAEAWRSMALSNKERSALAQCVGGAAVERLHGASAKKSGGRL